MLQPTAALFLTCYICDLYQVLASYARAGLYAHVHLNDAASHKLLHTVRTWSTSTFKGSITVVGLQWTSRPANAVRTALILPCMPLREQTI